MEFAFILDSQTGLITYRALGGGLSENGESKSIIAANPVIDNSGVTQRTAMLTLSAHTGIYVDFTWPILPGPLQPFVGINLTESYGKKMDLNLVWTFIAKKGN